MSKLTLADAQANLASVISTLRPGIEILITDQNRPVAKLTGVEWVEAVERKPRQAGGAIGQLHIISDDDDHLADFAEYMP